MRGELGIEDVLARLIELVHSAGFAKTLGELTRGFRRGLRLRQKAAQLACRNSPEVGPAGVAGEPQRLFGRAKLRLAKTVCCDLRTRRQRRECENIRDDAALYLDFSGARQPLHQKRWIGREARLHHGRFGNPEFVVGGLQPAIVEQRNLHSRIGGQWLAQQNHHLGAGGGGLGGRPNRGYVLVEFATGDSGHKVHAAVGRHGLARR